MLHLAFDLSGYADPAPVADGASALLSLARGQWLNALLNGTTLFPYVGDLARQGKLAAYVTTVEKAVDLVSRSRSGAAQLTPGMERLLVALDALPRNANPLVDRITNLVRDFLRREQSTKLHPEKLLDVSQQFRFFTRMEKDHLLDIAAGRLGVPSKVRQHRSGHQQSKVSRQTGDDAGHRIGNQFGAPGDARNLARQNWIQNRSGTWRQLEDRWARMLEAGIGVEVTVTDVYRKAEARPFRRDVEWTEVYPDGRRATRKQSENVTFGNFETVESRTAAGDKPEEKSSGDNVTDMQQWKQDREKQGGGKPAPSREETPP